MLHSLNEASIQPTTAESGLAKIREVWTPPKKKAEVLKDLSICPSQCTTATWNRPSAASYPRVASSISKGPSPAFAEKQLIIKKDIKMVHVSGLFG